MVQILDEMVKSIFDESVMTGNVNEALCGRMLVDSIVCRPPITTPHSLAIFEQICNTVPVTMSSIQGFD